MPRKTIDAVKTPVVDTGAATVGPPVGDPANRASSSPQPTTTLAAAQVLMKSRPLVALLGVLVVAALGWLWEKTRSLNPEDHARIDSALRELRSLDRTINQDVLRARYQLIDNYDPVLRSYRQIEQLEAVLATPPRYLDDGAKQKLSAAVAEYRAAVTSKQAVIETFKYRSADLKELLTYLPGAGTGVAKAALDGGDDALSTDVNALLRQTLLYNLTSEEKYAPIVRAEVDAIGAAGERARSPVVRSRVRTLVLNVRTLLRVKPEVDRLLGRVFEEPVIAEEENVARIYYSGYATAEHVAARYRLGLYGLCIALFTTVVLAVRRLQHTAKALAASNEGLEGRVADRTRELASRNREMRAVLDNVDQALFTVDLDGRLSRERSAALDRWFPHAAPGAQLWTVIEMADPNAAIWLTMGWDQLRDAFVPPEVVVDQLPRKLAFDGRHYEIGYRPIGEEARLEKILLVISDVTDAVVRARREAEQQEQLVIFQHLMRDGAEFMEGFAELERLAAAALTSEPTDKTERLRAIHTLKGNCGIYGVTSVVEACHDLESTLVDSGDAPASDDMTRLRETWAGFAGKVHSLSRTGYEARIEVTPAQFASLRRAVITESRGEALDLLRYIEREPAERRLGRLSEYAKSLARRVGKGDIFVTVEANDVRFDRDRWSPFWSAFVHMLRNAVDHGIEDEADRLAAGKPAVGHIHLRATQAKGRVIVEVSDDGRGIDWEAIRVKARELGLASRTGEELLSVLLRGGISTSSTVTELSGRGAGIGACHAECLALGGELSVSTVRDQSTTFRFSIPADDAAIGALTSAA